MKKRLDSTRADAPMTSAIEALGSAWAQIAEEDAFPLDYEGTPSPEAHRACEAIQERIRERIVATNDMRLFGLLHAGSGISAHGTSAVAGRLRAYDPRGQGSPPGGRRPQRQVLYPRRSYAGDAKNHRPGAKQAKIKKFEVWTL